MKIKIIIDGGEGMEDAARKIADLMDAVETIRDKRKRKKSERKYQESARRMEAYREGWERAKAAAMEVYKKMQEEEGQEKSPAEDTAGDKEFVAITSLDDGDGNDGIVTKD